MGVLFISPKHYLLLAPKHWARTRALLRTDQLRAELGVLDIPDLADLRTSPVSVDTPE